MIITGGAPIEPAIFNVETPIKKAPHYPTIPFRNEH